MLPVGFVAVLLAIKSAEESTGGGLTNDIVPALIPGNFRTFRPLSYRDYVTAAKAERTCVIQENGKLGISGILDQGENWMVPMVKCDHRKCKFEGEDASPYCEYSIIGVAGDNDGAVARAESFKDWIYFEYPELESSMPFDFEAIQVFDSSADMNNYVRRDDYGNAGVPKMMMGVVFESDDDDNYNYRLRMNQTNFNNPADEARPGMSPDTILGLDYTFRPSL